MIYHNKYASFHDVGDIGSGLAMQQHITSLAAREITAPDLEKRLGKTGTDRRGFNY